MAEMMAIWAVYIKISWLCYIKNSNVNQLDMNFACFSVGLFALFTITRIRYIDARHDKIFPFVSSSHIKFILPSQRASKHALTSYWLQFSVSWFSEWCETNKNCERHSRNWEKISSVNILVCAQKCISNVYAGMVMTNITNMPFSC